MKYKYIFHSYLTRCGNDVNGNNNNIYSNNVMQQNVMIYIFLPVQSSSDISQ